LKRKKPGKRSVKVRAVKNTVQVQRIPPSAEAARDEGPRLIHLADRSKEPSRLEHYLELADRALGRKPGSKTGSR
jgi:hypothetical protein